MKRTGLREITEKNYYYRISKDHPLIGPFTFYDADSRARFLSRDKTQGIGLAEVVTFLGSRPGDHTRTPSELRVVYVYVEGKRTLSGKAAQFNAEKGIPSPRD